MSILPRRMVVTCLVAPLICALPLLGACASTGAGSVFGSDPLTGGVDTATSALLNVPLPAGMQRYSSHGFTSTTAAGGRQGLEVLRGRMDAAQASLAMFTALKSHGWQLRLALSKESRMLQVYEKGGEMAVLAFRSQGMLTILDIWTGERLPDGASLQLPAFEPDPAAGGAELAGEEFGPLDESARGPAPKGAAGAPEEGTTEEWGAQGSVRERAL